MDGSAADPFRIPARLPELVAVAPVIVAADIHEPSSGNIDALRVCIEHMQRNGLDSRPRGSNTWPRFSVDMGYSTKREFPWLMLEKQYSCRLSISS